MSQSTVPPLHEVASEDLRRLGLQTLDNFKMALEFGLPIPTAAAIVVESAVQYATACGWSDDRLVALAHRISDVLSTLVASTLAEMAFESAAVERPATGGALA